jgi:hypothetical protein
VSACGTIKLIQGKRIAQENVVFRREEEEDKGNEGQYDSEFVVHIFRP